MAQFTLRKALASSQRVDHAAGLGVKDQRQYIWGDPQGDKCYTNRIYRNISEARRDILGQGPETLNYLRLIYNIIGPQAKLFECRQRRHSIYIIGEAKKQGSSNEVVTADIGTLIKRLEQSEEQESWS